MKRKLEGKITMETEREIKDCMFYGRNGVNYILYLIISLISTLVLIIAPITLNQVIKDVGKITFTDIIKVVSIMAAGYILRYMSVFLKTRLGRFFGKKATGKIYSKIFEMNYDDLIKTGATVLQSKTLEAVQSFSNLYLDVFPNLFINTLTIVITVVIVYMISPLASFIMLLTLPVHYIGFKLLNKKLSELSIGLNNTSSKAFRDIISIVSQFDFIKQNSQNSHLIPMIEAPTDTYEDLKRKINNVAIGVSGLIIGLNQIIQSLVVIYLSSLALANPDKFGGVIYVIIVYPYFSMAIRTLSATNLSLAELKAAKEFISSIVRSKEENGESKAPSKVKTLELCLDNVAVGEKVLLRDINLKFSAGDIIGLRGESGMGKSSLLKLLPKFREASGIKINNMDIREMDNDSLRTLVSYYSQNLPIISDTLINNFNFGREKLDEEKYRKIKFLDKFKDFNEMIYEDGANLSGGDRQRIALARYFTEDASIVILDEPTSSLDKKTEEEILNEILRNNLNKIIFLISHNDNVLKKCNKIIEIKDNKAVVDR